MLRQIVELLLILANTGNVLRLAPSATQRRITVTNRNESPDSLGSRRIALFSIPKESGKKVRSQALSAYNQRPSIAWHWERFSATHA